MRCGPPLAGHRGKRDDKKSTRRERVFVVERLHVHARDRDDGERASDGDDDARARDRPACTTRAGWWGGGRATSTARVDAYRSRWTTDDGRPRDGAMGSGAASERG